ncbi:MAG: oligopeptide:H+ symporter [Deltaproteobacteria bacterium]|nr:oligopeptide:H+ symporter [Deltaproteobacteria bacterium]
MKLKEKTPPAAESTSSKLPPQIPFIIGNEGCERFSFYGMRNVLTTFLITYLLLDVPEAQRAIAAKDVMHTFIIGVYFFPLLGGWIADRYLGKYNTIFYLSLVYCAGHACLAIFESWKPGFFIGLGLIALGSGGIKPCVSSFVGDQFSQSNKHLAKVVFDAFYWIINFGSFFASLLIPFLLKTVGASVAFGVPGVLMFIATVVLWLGRKQYVMVPARPKDPHAFSKIVIDALASSKSGGIYVAIAGVVVAVGLLLRKAATMIATELEMVDASWVWTSLDFVPTFCLSLLALLVCVGAGAWLELDRVRGKHPDDAVDGVRSVLRVLVLFALVTPFWSLFDQKTSTWVIQAGLMSKPEWFSPSQMQALNPLLVMILIPFNNLVLYPALKRAGLGVTPLQKMTFGIAVSGLAWVVVGFFQLSLDASGGGAGAGFSIVWQILPYAILTFGEVLVSATGLEFAYSQAPPSMKGVLMSFWNLSVTMGNLWVLLANAAVKNDDVTKAITGAGWGVTAFQMFFFAGFAFVAAVVFGMVASRYKVVDHYRR